MKISNPASKPRLTLPTSTSFKRVSIALLPLQPGGGRASAGPVKILLNPRMVQGEQFFNRSDRDHLLVSQHRHPVAYRPQSVEIMGDQEDRQLQAMFELLDELIEAR